MDNTSRTRRVFLKNVAGAAVGLFAANLARSAVFRNTPARPLFSFVQLTDTHVSTVAMSGYAKANEKLESIIDTINTEKNFPLPDFVILTGDIVIGSRLELLASECMLAKEILAHLRCPYYTVIGNHDVLGREGDPVYQHPYEKVFGVNRVNYHFIHKGILFVCLNNSNGCGNGLGMPERIENNPKHNKWLEEVTEVTCKRNQWLKAILQKYPKMPKIIACHVPMVPLREEIVLKESFGFPSYTMMGDGTANIIRASKETVIAVIHGHLHLTGMVKKEGICHICPAGSASYPCHYAHYAVYHNRIDVRMYQLDHNLVTPETNIHGRPRYDHDFTDTNHSTPEKYVCGTKAENKFTIPLCPAKRPVATVISQHNLYVL